MPIPPALETRSYALTLAPGIAMAIHRFGASPEAIPIVLIHGSIEDSRIFHSRSGKGLAPYLATNGYDVFAPDLPGKGQSVPRIRRGFSHSQTDFISRDLPLMVAHIQSLHPGKKIALGAHSWGGVLLLAYLARYGDASEFGPAVFFASKRRISVLSLRRLLMVDLMWTLVGELATMVKGYLPAKSMGLGSQDEPAAFYRQVNKWVYQKAWKDEGGYDYRKKLQSMNLPPILYLAGAHDWVLGHPKDVRTLMQESGQSNAKFMLLGKSTGHQKDYGHIDILTGRACTTDHFPIALKWLKTAGNVVKR
jgi:predicted alpha/beta hydrolase